MTLTTPFLHWSRHSSATADHSTCYVKALRWRKSLCSVLRAFINPRALLVSALCLIWLSLTTVGFSGSNLNQGLAGWFLVPSPNIPPTAGNPNVYNFLQGVACGSAADCWAVGYTTFSSRTASVTNPGELIEHWDGNSWSTVSSPSSPATTGQFAALNGITCPSASECWAVGYSQVNIPNTVSSPPQTRIEHWDGAAKTWSIVSSPNSLDDENVLSGVTCASTSDCWAVGISDHPSVSGFDYRTLIEHWDGSSWTLVSPLKPSVTTTTNQSFLSGVACASASDCSAVGDFYSSDGIKHTLTEHWDGSSWSIVNSSNAANNVLSSVTCPAASDCWAVGYGPGGTLTEHWDGKSWSVIASPNRTDRSTMSAPETNYLTSVTCASTSNCWAVGASNYLGQLADGTPSALKVTLTEHWDGASWSIVSSGNNANQIPGFPSGDVVEYNDLASVTCPSASDCWVVGNFLLDDGMGQINQTLVERYTTSLPPVAYSVVSTKLHGGAGSFDIDLPITGNPGIECRSGGANGNYTLVFTFSDYLTNVDGANITSGTGTITSGNISNSDTHQYFVNLSGVTNAQKLTITLANVYDVAGNASAAVAVPMGVLIGDTNGDGAVNSADIGQTKSQSGQSVTSSNFREDVNADGFINSGDIGLVKSKSGTALP